MEQMGSAAPEPLTVNLDLGQIEARVHVHVHLRDESNTDTTLMMLAGSFGGKVNLVPADGGNWWYTAEWESPEGHKVLVFGPTHEPDPPVQG